jgi:microcystin-dependent protein
MSYLAICPTGTVFPFAGTIAPNGWLLCDGSAVSRTIYSRLFSVLSSSCGSGDGSTTFNIPDYRGVFMRGVDGGTTRDPDRTARTAMNPGGNTGANVGSIQGIASARSEAGSGTNPYTNPNASKSTAGLTNSSVTVSVSGTAASAGAHSHPITGFDDERTSNSEIAIGASGTPLTGNTQSAGAHTHSVSASGTAPAQTISGDNETRPKNAYVNYIIKV